MQHDIFLAREADNWFIRNKADLETFSGDYLTDFFFRENLGGKKILDVGCGFPIRLNEFYKQGAECWGVDPSNEALREGQRKFPKLVLTRGTSDSLPFNDEFFDILIMAFVFHWVDRSKLFKTVSEVDRVLKPGGMLAIMDFFPDTPHRREYHHNKELGIFTFKQKYADIFAASNIYTEVECAKFRHPNGLHYDWHQKDDSLTGGDNDGIMTIFKKDLESGYPVRRI